MKNITLDNIDQFSDKEAAKAGPFGADDKPCTITCYRETVEWKSVKAAMQFYKIATISTNGSESYRYGNIWSKLKSGHTVVDDSNLFC